MDKQIEEMKKHINNAFDLCYKTGESDITKAIAEELIKYYQPKIPEGSVVLYHDEAQKYYAYKIIEPQIKGCLDRERALEKQLKEAHKQAVKEVLGKIKEEINQAIKSNYKVIKDEPNSTIIYQWCKGKIDALRGIDNYIDEIAKEMGVEV